MCRGSRAASGHTRSDHQLHDVRHQVHTKLYVASMIRHVQHAPWLHAITTLTNEAQAANIDLRIYMCTKCCMEGLVDEEGPPKVLPSARFVL